MKKLSWKNPRKKKMQEMLIVKISITVLSLCCFVNLSDTLLLPFVFVMVMLDIVSKGSKKNYEAGMK